MTISATVLVSCHRSGASLRRLFLSSICNSPFAVYLAAARQRTEPVRGARGDAQPRVLLLELLVDLVVRRAERVDVGLVYRGPRQPDRGACPVRDDAVPGFAADATLAEKIHEAGRGGVR